MKFKRLILLILLSSSNILGQSLPPFNFAFSLDDPYYNATYDITTDSQGNIYTTGDCGSNMDMDPSNNTVLAGASGMFVAKYSPTGAYLWHKVITSSSGGYGYGHIQSVKINQSGDILLGGTYSGQLDFNPGPGIANKISTIFYPGQDPSCDPENQDCCLPEDSGCFGEYSIDFFLVSLTSEGNFKWCKAYGGVGTEDLEKIAIDANNNVLLIAGFQADIDIEGTIYTSAGYSQVMILKFDANGILLLTYDFPSLGRGLAINCDNLGNFYAATWFIGTVDFDPGGGVANVSSSGSADIAIIKFNSSGTFLWVKTFAGFQHKNMLDLIIDSNGDILTLGYFEGSCDFDPGPGTNTQFSVGLADTYIAKLNSAGNLLWVKTLQGINDCLGIALASNSANDVIATGYYKFTVDFNPGAANYPLASNGEFDLFQVALNASGDFKWAHSYGGVADDYGTAITCDPFGRIITAGWYESSNIDFDPSFSGSKLLPLTGPSSIFVQSLGVPANCLDDFTVSNVTGNNDFYADEFIIGNGTVNAGTINFQAGNYIQLEPGFVTGSSTIFKAMIGSCP